MKIIGIKQAVLVGKTPSMDVFNLPCVACLIKDPKKLVSDYGFYYKVDTPDERIAAFTGDWICKCEDGKWRVLDSSEYNLYFTKHETK